MSVPFALAVVVALSVMATFVGLMRLVEREPPFEGRLESYSGRALSIDQPQRREKRGAGPSPLAARLNEAIASQDFAGDIAAALAQADLRLTVPEYVLLHIACACLSFLLGMMVFHEILSGLILAGLGFFLPGGYLKWRQRKRLRAFEDQLSDVLTLLVGSLRAGYSLLHAMSTIAEEVPPPASQEFSRVVREVGLGLSLPEALANLVRRVDSDDLELMVTAINIQHEVGGDLATILDTISETIRERVRIQGEIRVMTTQQTITGYILTFLPFILGGIMFLLSPQYMMRLFTPGWTLLIPFSALVAMVLGFLVMRKIVAIEV